MGLAFPRKRVWTIENSIKAMHARMCSIHQIGFTHDEFLSLLAPKEHWSLLKGASEIACVDENSSVHYCELRSDRLKSELGEGTAEIRFDINMIDGRAPLRPRNTVVRDDAPAELVERLTSWVIARVNTGTEFARAIRLMHWMDDHCTLQQVRYFWPSIVPILTWEESTKPIADKARALKAPREIPHIPMEVRAACRQTAQAIAMVSLLGENQDTVPAPVNVTMNTGGKMVQEGALDWVRPLM